MAALFINPNITSAGVAAAAASFQQSNISVGPGRRCFPFLQPANTPLLLL